MATLIIKMYSVRVIAIIKIIIIEIIIRLQNMRMGYNGKQK